MIDGVAAEKLRRVMEGRVRAHRDNKKTQIDRASSHLEHISHELFCKFQDLIYSETGIWLGTHKTALLVGRLSRRLRSLHLSSMAEYFTLISQPDQQQERMRMIDCITTNETHFFREPRHFEYLAHTVFPRWRQEVLAGVRTPHVRIWSAACSTGEEPYSLAMMLLDHFGVDSGWKFEILATDISSQVLEKARNGIFPISRLKEIPSKYLRNYMLKGTGEQHGRLRISPEVQNLVTFARVNLNADSFDVFQPFDLILLRNVMIYFDQKAKRKVLAKIENRLSPGGYLFVGPSESLQALGIALRPIIPSVYAKCEDGKKRDILCGRSKHVSKSVLGAYGDPER